MATRPQGRTYRVLFVRRPRATAAASQAAIPRRGARASLERAILVAALDGPQRQAPAQLKERRFAHCTVQRPDLPPTPHPEAARIAGVPGLDAACEATTRQADPAPYRRPAAQA